MEHSRKAAELVTLPPVLFLLPQTSASANGGITSISQVIAGLRSHRPIIVTNRRSAQTEQWLSDGIETHLLPVGPSGLRSDPVGTLRSYWQTAAGLQRLVAASDATVVHVNSPVALQLALPAVKLRGARVALNLRGTMDPDHRPLRMRYRFLFGAADHVLFLSHDMADRWAKVAPNAKRKFSVTYSIVDTDKFAPAPPYRGEGPPVALLSGVVRPLKGQLDFLRCVSPVLAAQGIATWIAGDFEPEKDAYMRACAEAAAPLGEMVRFLGYRRDIPDLMRRSAVVAVPSRHEGLVRAMIEGMSCARPVVSFDVCSASELLEKKSGGAGTVVAGGDHEAMAEAIVRYCGHPQVASETGRKGRETALELFSPAEVVGRYESIYTMLGSSN